MIKIIDAIMGAGKSTYLIDMINRNPDKKYLIVVPMLSEVIRYRQSIKNTHVIEPNTWGHNKSEHLVKLLSEGKNVITTHQLIIRANKEIQEIIRKEEYVLIIDEALNIFSSFILSKDDWNLLREKHIILVDKEHRVTWNDLSPITSEYEEGIFASLKSLLKSGYVFYPFFNEGKKSNTITLVWNFPPDFFQCFKNTYIATYMWDKSFQQTYFDFYGVEYSHYSLSSNELKAYSPEYEKPLKLYYKNLIHLIDDPKLNEVGRKKGKSNPLSKGWFISSTNKEKVEQLRKNIYNFFRCKAKSKSDDNMWTTYKAAKNKLTGKGYTGSEKNICFVPLGTKCTNDYSSKSAVVFAANLFMEPFLKNFFVQKGINIPEDWYALTEMIQWIWRSAIRVGKPIELYVPSERMRSLLTQWLEK